MTPAHGVPPTASADGCGANDIPVPQNADTSPIPDVDGDGRPDVQFFVEGHRFGYGIHTASGATIIVDDDLAGPGRHHGWTAVREHGVITVLDDSREATLHALIDCRFVTTLDPFGKPFRFSLQGNDGTGIRCTNSNGGLLLYGVSARQGANGEYDITERHIEVREMGRRAQLGSRELSFASGLAANDPAVAAAQESRCGSIPRVQTSGR